MVSTSKNKNDDHRVKEICNGQYKLHIKPTTSLYFEIQQCQMHVRCTKFLFFMYCNLKEKRSY